mmetsp:Transcript_36126/g.80401  ORF Transcript_36126/g.80401 Transcript_36126/m.80401 type:complete len:206 (-) Transcript_36126:1818-2435(-)
MSSSPLWQTAATPAPCWTTSRSSSRGLSPAAPLPPPLTPPPSRQCWRHWGQVHSARLTCATVRCPSPPPWTSSSSTSCRTTRARLRSRPVTACSRRWAPAPSSGWCRTSQAWSRQCCHSWPRRQRPAAPAPPPLRPPGHWAAAAAVPPGVTARPPAPAAAAASAGSWRQRRAPPLPPCLAARRLPTPRMPASSPPLPVLPAGSAT